MSLLGKPAPPNPVMKTVAPSETPSSAAARLTRLSNGIPSPGFFGFYPPLFRRAMTNAPMCHDFAAARIGAKLASGTRKRNEKNAAALVAAFALCAQGADHGARDRHRGPDRNSPHDRRGLGAECRADEGKSAEPAADAAAAGRDRHLRLGCHLRIFRFAAHRREAVSRE